MSLLTWAVIGLWLGSGLWAAVAFLTAQPLRQQGLTGYSSEPLSEPPAYTYRWVTYADIRADIERMRKRRAAAGVRIDLNTDIIRN